MKKYTVSKMALYVHREKIGIVDMLSATLQGFTLQYNNTGSIRRIIEKWSSGPFPKWISIRRISRKSYKVGFETELR